MFDPVLQLLGRYQVLLPDIRSHLLLTLRIKELKKNEPLLRSGQVCDSIYFINKGLLGCFWKKGRERIYEWFMTEGKLAVSISSFFKQVASDETIIALKPT